MRKAAVLHRRTTVFAAAVAVPLAAALLATACAGGAPGEPDAAGVEAGRDHDADGGALADADAHRGTDAGARADTDTRPGTDAGDAPDPRAAAAVGANELGRIPVLMYHRLREDGGSVYDLTTDEYRAELEWLFDHGYRPIRVADLVRGEIDVPAGTTPVVLTFDDSTREQAQLTGDGELAPDTALGILVEIAAGYDDVEAHASVYVVTSSLFGGGPDGPQILATLHDLGMEIGSHTHTHRNLGHLTEDEVVEELARATAEIRAAVPDAEVATVSLPLGVFPEPRELVAQGSTAAGEYRHEGVLLVGAEPSPSPFHVGFEPLAIPRIRTAPDWSPGDEPDYGSGFWLDWLDAEEGRRYVSDGDPDTVSFPAELADQLDPRWSDRANPY